MWIGSELNPSALPRMRSLALWSTTPPVTGYEPNFFDDDNFSETTEIFIRESSRDTRPSYLHDLEIDDYTIGRALSHHHFSLRSEKIQRPVDKLITLLTKACCQVSRCLSVMIEQGDLFPMSLIH